MPKKQFHFELSEESTKLFEVYKKRFKKENPDKKSGNPYIWEAILKEISLSQ